MTLTISSKVKSAKGTRNTSSTLARDIVQCRTGYFSVPNGDYANDDAPRDCGGISTKLGCGDAGMY